MRRIARFGLFACLFATLALAAGAAADPGEEHADDIPTPVPSLPKAPPGIDRMELLDVEDKDGTINSDIAFYGDRAYVGNFDGFRIIDIRKPHKMQVLSDTTCRANQGDLSVFKASDGRLIMLQSIDRPVTAPDCTGVDTATVTEDELGIQRTRARFGYEGLRVFDVTDPTKPEFLTFYRTECGSHTHTVVPDNGEVHIYVPSYPLGTHITPQIDRAESEALGLTCDAPHSKISIVSIPLSDPEAGTVGTEALSSDTEFFDPDGPFHPAHDDHPATGTQPAFQACHDHQVFEPRELVAAACAGDAQIWDISDPGDPTASNGETHTHIQREVAVDNPATPENERWESFDFIHNATISWDGQVVAFTDEAGGGVEARCDGPNTKRGFTFFYPLVEPGTPVNGFTDLMGRYMVPRAQGTEICVSHNGNVLPTKSGRLQVQAFYQAGNSFLDFTDPSAPEEIGFSDIEDGVGASDSWSSYWYNDVLYVNGGLNRRATGNRGFEAYAVFDANGERIVTRDWAYLNPQTQESFQLP
jgi:LVIVD repeat